MIIVRTPFRISFFGGGTDFPAYYTENGGAVLSTTIDKYCYISCRRLPPFFEYKHRLIYSKTEHVNEIDQITHPAVKAIFQFMKVEEGLEIHHDGDLPARTGLGSSSSFTVGLLHALYALYGKMVSKKRLALEAIDLEQNAMKEHVGSQDQVAVAFGGLNKIGFRKNRQIDVLPLTISRERVREFEEHLILVFTGFTRYASELEKEKIKQFTKKLNDFKALHAMVDEGIDILNGDGDITDFGRVLHESWQLKRSLSDGVSNRHIDDIYDRAMSHKAVGGKVLGAGGGGFMLFFVRPEDRDYLIKGLSPLLHVPFRFDTTGSQVIFYSESGV